MNKKLRLDPGVDLSVCGGLCVFGINYCGRMFLLIFFFLARFCFINLPFRARTRRGDFAFNLVCMFVFNKNKSNSLCTLPFLVPPAVP